MFSEQSGFYEKSLTIRLEYSEAAQIYYTLDGSNPEPNNQNAILYKEDIFLQLNEQETIYTIKAAAYEHNTGVLLEEDYRTYIIGEQLDVRYNIPILCISGNPKDFYNYENGILTSGKLDDEYIETHPEWADFFQQNQIPVFGNLYQKGKAAEKKVAMTLFDEKGDVILDQNCGFRLYGAISRMKNQPSFRLYARAEYDEMEDFEYAFFSDEYTSENTIIDNYNRVIVRNSGNDNGYAFMRSEVATRIAKEAGFPDSPAASPVCVYLNGKYYGMYWFVTNFDDKYFKKKYGSYDGEMYIFEGMTHALELDVEQDDEVYLKLGEEYNKQYEFYANADLSNNENWKKLNEFIDVENFLKYMAIQNYISNEDSLYNNYRIYRYYSPDGKYFPETVFDGRYRFILFDLDFGLGLVEDHTWTEPESAMLTTQRISGQEPYTKLFANLLKREDCKQLYIKYFLALLNYYYAEEQVMNVVVEMHEERWTELQYMIEESELLINNFHAPDILDAQHVSDELHDIRLFAQNRPGYAMTDLISAFGPMSIYTMYVRNPNNASITLDYATFDKEDFVGNYLLEIPVSVSANACEGSKFSHWIVNGEEVNAPTFEVSADMIKDGVLEIQCVCVPDENSDLCISAIKAKGGDYIELYNPTTEDKNLSAYCLTDNETYDKSSLPRKVLKAGESVRIYCKNYSDLEALGEIGTNFNISAGETISLYAIDEILVDSVYVPELGTTEGVYKKDMATGVFSEVIEE